MAFFSPFRRMNGILLAIWPIFRVGDDSTMIEDGIQDVLYSIPTIKKSIKKRPPFAGKAVFIQKSVLPF